MSLRHEALRLASNQTAAALGLRALRLQAGAELAAAEVTLLEARTGRELALAELERLAGGAGGGATDAGWETGAMLAFNQHP